jgi:hypothetical protein
MLRRAFLSFCVTTLFATSAATISLANDVPTPTTGAAMTRAAQQFVASLSPDERNRAVLKFDDPRRLDWNNVPKPERKGLQLRDLTPPQQQLVHALLQTALSDTGYEKAVRITSLENNLREGEKNLVGGHLRDPLRYFLTIFGEPNDTGTWGWSFEGHHMSQNFVIVGGNVTCDSPSFWGACPATVKVFVENGPQVGTETLHDEEQLAFDLLASLNAVQRAKAVIAATSPEDYRNPGQPQPPHAPPTGLAAAEMTDAQQQILRKLLATYSGHLAPTLSAARIKDIDDHGFENVYFAWQGGDRPGVEHAYRVQGPTFLLELVNFQADPAGNPANHIHSVWRSLTGDFGVASRN